MNLREGAHPTAHVLRSQNNWQESGFSSHSVGPGEWTQSFGLSNKHFYLLSHHASQLKILEQKNYFSTQKFNIKLCVPMLNLSIFIFCGVGVE